MIEEYILLNVAPLNKDSLLLVSFDELKFPGNTDFNSIKVIDSNGRKLLFELIGMKGHSGKYSYSGGKSHGKNHIAVIAGSGNAKHIRIAYRLSNKPGKPILQENKIGMEISESNITVSTKNVSVFFEKNGYSLEKVSMGGKEYGPIRLAASGGDTFFQDRMRDAKFSIISDSSIVKIFKVTGSMKVSGNKCAKEGLLPVSITYSFWSADGKDMLAKAEIELEYDRAAGMDGRKAESLNPLLWYRLDNFSGKIAVNSCFTNGMGKSSIMTLKHPYYGYFSGGGNGAFFAMCPYVALPNDGIHMEKGKDFFGASWHSMSMPKKPYWSNETESTGIPQGHFPMHSLRSYWKIGMYFGCGKKSKKNIKDIASAFSYPPKIRSIAHLSPEQVSSACITRWKFNKRMAFNAITDDAKINDYIYRAEGKIPKWVQMAIATRTLGISYHRFCFIGNNLFYLKKFPLLSTLLSTLLCLIGAGKPLREKFGNENMSFLLHTNTHPRLYRLSAGSVRREILSSEKVWVHKWRNKTPLSHVFSYTSSYGLATEKGTMAKVAFSSSRSLQWIREWPIPNSPLDFFLPTPLLWGICVGEFFDKSSCKRIKDEFTERHRNGCDYMLISGHVPEYGAECPSHVIKMFRFFEKHKDVWFAGADDIIKYYKARESITLSPPRKKGKSFAFDMENSLPQYFLTEITLIQRIIKKIKRIQFTQDGKTYSDASYKFIGKKLVMYNLPSNAKRVVIS
ncbi:hypothetical protein HYV80_02250 [Candidatus Woesearchaeota archaeon]|nr:hypothetical protein [Candidatus Woesearchaeota archaeon]